MAETAEIFDVWASIAGLTASSSNPATIVGWADRDIAFEIRRFGERWSVHSIERSDAVLGTFSDRTSAECLLLLLMGRIWRRREGLPRAEAAELAQGVELEASPAVTRLRWAGGDGEFAPGRPGRFLALDVSHLVWRTPQEITDALLMPDAGGLFAAHPTAR